MLARLCKLFVHVLSRWLDASGGSLRPKARPGGIAPIVRGSKGGKTGRPHAATAPRTAASRGTTPPGRRRPHTGARGAPFAAACARGHAHRGDPRSPRRTDATGALLDCGPTALYNHEQPGLKQDRRRSEGYAESPRLHHHSSGRRHDRRLYRHAAQLGSRWQAQGGPQPRQPLPALATKEPAWVQNQARAGHIHERSDSPHQDQQAARSR